MYSNVFYDTRQSLMHVWSYKDGVKTHDTREWVPYVFVDSHKSEDTGVVTIDGDKVYPKHFNTFKEYNAFQKDNYCYENKVPPPIQFLTERYNIDDPDLPKLHIAYIDIETPYEFGFPEVSDTPAPIVLISVIDEEKKVTVFGLHEYSGPNKGSFDYVECSNEGELLNVFFNWMHRQQFDVITGWNITPDSKTNRYGGFDIPYIIRRSVKLMGEKGSSHRLLSPINNVRIWETNIDGVFNVDIAGVSIIDYLGLYKWFTTKNLESFTLDYVAEVELGRNKTDHSEYDTFWEFYIKDWNLMVDYCIEDCNIVRDLETKTGFMSLAQTLSCYCCCQMKNYNASVPLIEGLMLKHFRKNGLCAPYMAGGTQEWFPAAYVKPPHVGIHKDVIDLDIASSYPTHIIILNMSIETYIGRIVGFQKDDVMGFKTNSGIHEPLHEGRPIYRMNVEHTRNREFPAFHILNSRGIEFISGPKLTNFNRLLKGGRVCIAPNGAVFSTSKEGVIAHVEKKTYLERVKQKGLKAEYKRKASEFDDGPEKDKYLEMSQNRHTLQLAIKILINSVFGIMGVPYCRYFNPHIAEAITSCGRHTIQQGEVFVDEYLNNPDDTLQSVIDEIKDLCK